MLSKIVDFFGWISRRDTEARENFSAVTGAALGMIERLQEDSESQAKRIAALEASNAAIAAEEELCRQERERDRERIATLEARLDAMGSE